MKATCTPSQTAFNVVITKVLLCRQQIWTWILEFTSLIFQINYCHTTNEIPRWRKPEFSHTETFNDIREHRYIPPFSADDKDLWSSTSTPRNVVLAQCLKRRCNRRPKRLTSYLYCVTWGNKRVGKVEWKSSYTLRYVTLHCVTLRGGKVT